MSPLTNLIAPVALNEPFSRVISLSMLWMPPFCMVGAVITSMVVRDCSPRRSLKLALSCSACSKLQGSTSQVCFGMNIYPSNITGDFMKALSFRKTPWRLSVTRKANQRKRLKRVDSVIEAVRASGIQCSSLVEHDWQYQSYVSMVFVGYRPTAAKGVRDARSRQIHHLQCQVERVQEGYPQSTKMDSSMFFVFETG